VTTSSKLTVSWRMSQPPVAAKSWHNWRDFVLSPSDNKLEAALGWPAGTVAVLEQGFKLGLGRTLGWEVDGAVGEDHGLAALQAAARVFRRGVAARHVGNTALERVIQGTYDIAIVQQQPDLNDAATFYILDGRVAALWPKLTMGPKRLVLTLDEHSKSLASVAQILASPHAQKSARWCVVGGGLLTDVAAFAASLCSATVQFVPTTLLAMADACVGGKTGVNFAPYGKNQIGTFYFPSHVTIWPGWLATLPERELLGGAAECLKHAFLLGDMVLAESLAAALRQRDLTALATLLPAVIKLKVDVVTADPAENGMRAILNFGHTLGHALEAYAHAHQSGAAILTHGEAVGVGMVFALLLSSKYAGLKPLQCQELIEVLKAAGCVLSAAELGKRLGATDLASSALRAALRALMANDKKTMAPAGAERAEWILLATPGVTARSSSGAWTTSLSLAVIDELWTDFLRVL